MHFSRLILIAAGLSGLAVGAPRGDRATDGHTEKVHDVSPAMTTEKYEKVDNGHIVKEDTMYYVIDSDGKKKAEKFDDFGHATDIYGKKDSDCHEVRAEKDAHHHDEEGKHSMHGRKEGKDDHHRKKEEEEEEEEQHHHLPKTTKGDGRHEKRDQKKEKKHGEKDKDDDLHKEKSEDQHETIKGKNDDRHDGKMANNHDEHKDRRTRHYGDEKKDDVHVGKDATKDDQRQV